MRMHLEFCYHCRPHVPKCPISLVPTFGFDCGWSDGTSSPPMTQATSSGAGSPPPPPFLLMTMAIHGCPTHEPFR